MEEAEVRLFGEEPYSVATDVKQGSVWRFWKAPIGESQSGLLGFRNKAMFSPLEK